MIYIMDKNQSESYKKIIFSEWLTHTDFEWLVIAKYRSL